MIETTVRWITLEAMGKIPAYRAYLVSVLAEDGKCYSMPAYYASMSKSWLTLSGENIPGKVYGIADFPDPMPLSE